MSLLCKTSSSDPYCNKATFISLVGTNVRHISGKDVGLFILLSHLLEIESNMKKGLRSVTLHVKEKKIHGEHLFCYA